MQSKHQRTKYYRRSQEEIVMDLVIFDLDGVLQKPTYPHPDLLLDVSEVVEVSYEELHRHYSISFTTNEALESYHVSFCHGDQEKIDKVKAFWRKMHENMPKAIIIPGALDLLQEVKSRGWVIYAWTKGSVEIQRGRLENIGLSEFFPEGQIIYSPRKGTVVGFREDLLDFLPDGRKIVVGDSYVQDIEPPLKVGGFTCVWIQWEQRPPKGADLDDPNLIVVENTQELATKFKEDLLDDV